jgi:hypothetical protein
MENWERLGMSPLFLSLCAADLFSIPYAKCNILQWKTIQQTRILYQHTATHPSHFRGKTRADFAALEACIHDYTGASPAQDDLMQEAGNVADFEEVNHADQMAAASLHELSSAGMYQNQSLSEQPVLDGEVHNGNLSEYGIWNDFWSMLGEEQALSFALGNGDEYNAGLRSI